MPVQSTIPSIKVTRPEIYFGELTNTDVYVKTRQQEFNYPQGDTNSLTSYEGTGGIVLGGFFRRLLIALDRGDLTQAAVQRRHHRREPAADAAQHPRRASQTLAPFLTFDADPYIVIGDGRPAVVDDGRVHDVGELSLRAALPARDASASTTCATASR